MKSIPFHVPLMEAEEIDAANQVLKSGWLTTGGKAKQFEDKFAAFVGAKHAVAVNSCTAALHLALDATGLQPGDEVIVPTLTFAATAEAVTYLKARPVLVDSEPRCGNISVQAVEAAITARTKAIIPVHFGGQPCDIGSILEIAARHNLHVIEDAAHAFPARYKGRYIGNISRFTCFSFYANKTITTGGEGGMVTTNDSDAADGMRRKSLHGIRRGEGWRYEIEETGFKYNLTDLAAAIGIAQLAKAERMWARRAEIAARYYRNLAGESAFILPAQHAPDQHAWHLFVVRADPSRLGISRDELIAKLRETGIGTSVHYIPLHMHRQYFGAHGEFPVAEQFGAHGFSLPIYPGLTDADVDRVCEALAGLAQRFHR